jgi:hypothetical protein
MKKNRALLWGFLVATSFLCRADNSIWTEKALPVTSSSNAISIPIGEASQIHISKALPLSDGGCSKETGGLPCMQFSITYQGPHPQQAAPGRLESLLLPKAVLWKEVWTYSYENGRCVEVYVRGDCWSHIEKTSGGISVSLPRYNYDEILIKKRMKTDCGTLCSDFFLSVTNPSATCLFPSMSYAELSDCTIGTADNLETNQAPLPIPLVMTPEGWEIRKSCWGTTIQVDATKTLGIDKIALRATLQQFMNLNPVLLASKSREKSVPKWRMALVAEGTGTAHGWGIYAREYQLAAPASTKKKCKDIVRLDGNNTPLAIWIRSRTKLPGMTVSVTYPVLLKMQMDDAAYPQITVGVN